MSDAILGVIAGWGLSTVGEAGRAWWGRRQAKRERRSAVQRAARLILEELLVADRATNPESRGAVAFEFGTRKLPTGVWNQNRETLTLAPEGAAEWETIARAFARIDELNWAYETKERPLSEMKELLEAVETSHELIVGAEAALRRLS